MLLGHTTRLIHIRASVKEAVKVNAAFETKDVSREAQGNDLLPGAVVDDLRRLREAAFSPSTVLSLPRYESPDPLLDGNVP